MHKLSYFFLALSLLCFLISGYFVWERYYDPGRLAFIGGEIPQPLSASPSAGFPVFLSIPDLDIHQDVYPSRVEKNLWPTTSKGISYLLSSDEPGMGNAVFYGHNWPRILGDLGRARIGQTIEVTIKSGKKLRFRITGIQVVSPKAVEILAPTDNPRITLYTCTGFFDSMRLVVVATPVTLQPEH